MTFRVVFLNLTFRDISSQLRCSEPSSFSVRHLEPCFRFGVQSHHLFLITTFRVVLLSLTFRYVGSQLRYSEPSSFSVWHSEPCFRFSVQSCISSLEFRATISSQLRNSGLYFSVWHSETSFSVTDFRAFILLNLAFKAMFFMWCSKLHLQFNIQSRISSLAFRAISSQLQCSESSFSVWHLEMSVLSYGVQSLHPSQFGVQSHVFSLAFRATSPVWRSEPYLQFGVQSHHLFSVMMFRVVILNLTFRDVSSQLRRSEPSSFSVRRSEPHLQFDV